MRIGLLQGDARRIALADQSVHCIISSPPYWSLRSYHTGKLKELELGREKLHDCSGWVTGNNCGECFVCHTRQYARELWRILRDDGIWWLNLGDSYNGSGGAGGDYNKGGLKEGQPRYDGRNISQLKPKDLCGVPWRSALALQADGWWLRAAPPWLKNNGMPESTKDRPNTAHEYWFMLTKRKNCYSDMEAVKVPVVEGTVKRLSEPNLENQEGSHRGHGGMRANGPIKAAGNMISRHWRTYDFGATALDEMIAEAQEYLNHLQDIKKNNGMLFRKDGSPEAIFCTTVGYSGSHYATFNPKMIEPIIKFSTSEEGACPKCGAPWVRVIKKGYRAPVDEEKISEMESKGVPRQKANLYGHNTREPRFYADNPDKTIGWKPSCDCCDLPGDVSIESAGLSPIPCTVFDPFSGTGVTCLVANQLGRIGIGMDLSLNYNALARERTGLRSLQAWESGGLPAEGKELASLPLFEGFSTDGENR